ncbi:YceD family protein [Halpernia sp.]|uniref:YceD family protein n=1 Tax=Halpernia sp. TaxID=2782209 RepID=UPI003A8F3B75
MDKFRNYDIAFSGLKDGKHNFRFEVNQAFFNLFETEQEFSNPKITADVLLNKHSTFLEIEINVAGTIQLVCDITTSEFDYPIENQIKVLVKFGEIYDDSDVDVIVIPHKDNAFNIAQLLYEDVVLTVPMKKVSPKLSKEDIALLEKFSPNEETETEKEEDIDPRWNALKNLKK